MIHSLQTFLAENNLSLLDLGGTFVGLFYIYYQFRVSWKLWVASFVMSLFYITLNLQGGLYALAGIYIYYCVAAIYGLWQWGGARLLSRFRKETADDQGVTRRTATERPVRHLPVRLLLILLTVVGMLTLALAGVLRILHEDQTLWADAFTSATSIVAMWILAKKYCEHWIFWLVVDCINCGLYIYLGPQYVFSACLFGFYALTCFFGYWYWLKQIPARQDA